jgi:hypothetical protein
MASAQVQHDGRVIGGLVADAFHTSGSCIFLAANRAPTTPPFAGGPSGFSEVQHRSMRPHGGWQAGTKSRFRVHLSFYFAMSFAMQFTT